MVPVSKLEKEEEDAIIKESRDNGNSYLQKDTGSKNYSKQVSDVGSGGENDDGMKEDSKSNNDKIYKFIWKLAPYINKAKDHHKGIPWEDFKMPFLKYATKVKITPDFRYLVVAQKLNNDKKLSLIKLNLHSDASENDDHLISIEKIKDYAHDFKLQNLDSRTNKFLELRDFESPNRITCIDFLVKKQTINDQKGTVGSSRINTSVKMNASMVAKPSRCTESIEFFFTGCRNGIIKLWNFADFEPIREFTTNIGVAIDDIICLSSTVFSQNSEIFQHFKEIGIVVLSSHYDGTIRKIILDETSEIKFSQTKKVSPDYMITAMACARIDEDDFRQAVGNSHGQCAEINVESFFFTKRYYKVGLRNNKITKIIYSENAMFAFDGSGSIKKFEISAEDESTIPAKMNRVLGGAIKTAAQSPDHQFLVAASREHLIMVKTSDNAVIKEWKLTDNEDHVTDLIYTNHSIMQFSTEGIKIRFDTNFAFEEKFKVEEYREVSAIAFRHNIIDNDLYFFVIGKSFSEEANDPDKAHWNKLSISAYKKDPEGKKSQVQKFRTPKQFKIYGNCYAFKITPDDKKLVAASYQMIGDERCMSFINVYSIEDDYKLVFSWKDDNTFAILDIDFSFDSNFMFASFLYHDPAYFNITISKEESIAQKEPKILEPIFVDNKKNTGYGKNYSIILTKDQKYIVQSSEDKISIYYNSFIGDKDPMFKIKSQEENDKFVLDETQEKNRREYIKNLFPITYTTKEPIVCILADEDPKFFFAQSSRGTLKKFLIRTTIDLENLSEIGRDVVKVNLILVSEIKSEFFDPIIPSDENAKMLLYKAPGKRISNKNVSKVLKKVEKAFDIKDAQAGDNITNDEIKKIFLSNLNDDDMTVSNQTKNENDADHQGIDLIKDFSQKFIGEEVENIYIIILCQGNVSFYSRDLKFVSNFINRNHIMHEERVDLLKEKTFRIFDTKYYVATSSKTIKNTIELQPDKKCLILNCYNDVQNELNFIDLDSFYHKNDCFEQSANYCHSLGIKYYNVLKKMNFMTSFILSTQYAKFEKVVSKNSMAIKEDEQPQKFFSQEQTKRMSDVEDIQLPKYINSQHYKNSGKLILNNVDDYAKVLKVFENPQAILDQYKEVSIITEADVEAIIHCLSLFGYEEFIPKFVDIIQNNTLAKKPRFSFILDVFKKQSENVKEKLISIIVKNMFVMIPKLYGTKDLIETKFVRSSLTYYDFPESEDHETFEITPGKRNPIEINLYKFLQPNRLWMPDSNFYSFQLDLDEFGSEDEEFWIESKFVDWMDSLWKFYKQQSQIYLIISFIPQLCNFIIGLYITSGKPPVVFPIIVSASVVILNIYEVLQIIAAKGNTYWEDPLNYIDILAQVLTQVSSFYILLGSEEITTTAADGTVSTTLDDSSKNIYVLAQLFQTIKFYFNLKTVDFVRDLTNKIFDIIYAINAFLFVMVIFLLCFTNVFYVNYFIAPDNKTWLQYLLQTYYILFGAFEDPSPYAPGEGWVWSVWSIFTIIFTIVLFNLLIVLINGKYEKLVENNTRTNTREQLGLVIEVCQLRVTIQKYYLKFCLRKTDKQYIAARNTRMKYSYLIYESAIDVNNEDDVDFRENVYEMNERIVEELDNLQENSDRMIEKERFLLPYINQNKKSLDGTITKIKEEGKSTKKDNTQVQNNVSLKGMIKQDKGSNNYAERKQKIQEHQQLLNKTEQCLNYYDSIQRKMAKLKESIDKAEKASKESIEDETKLIANKLDKITNKIGTQKFKKNPNDLIQVDTEFQK